MSEKHLEAGDALPPYTGKLRLFSMRFCPFAHKTVLTLNAKNLPYESVNINLDKKPEWIYSFSPKGTVPAIEYEEGKAIYDSNILNLYLDEKYPEIPLQAADPLQRAFDRLFLENFSGVQAAYVTGAFNAPALTPTTYENYHKGLELLQKELESRGTTFLFGDKPGLIDFTIWPILERLEALVLLGNEKFAIDKSKYERLLKYFDAMKDSPPVKAYYLTPESHVKFLESRSKGEANYNMFASTGGACCMRPRKKKE